MEMTDKTKPEMTIPVQTEMTLQMEQEGVNPSRITHHMHLKSSRFKILFRTKLKTLLSSKFQKSMNLQTFRDKLSEVLNADGATKFQGMRCSKSVLNTLCLSHKDTISKMTWSHPG
jgi:hypothetical protein